ncbi:hypothetical protein C7212DRAFT_233062, partial [Tuber magnatum]
PYILGDNTGLAFTCVPLWQDFLSFYVVTTGPTMSVEGKWKCVLQRGGCYREGGLGAGINAAYNRRLKQDVNFDTRKPE